jgi:hypothetical protein
MSTSALAPGETASTCRHPWEALQWNPETGEVVCRHCGQVLSQDEVIEIDGYRSKLKESTAIVLNKIRQLDAEIEAGQTQKEQLMVAAGILSDRKCKHCGRPLSHQKLARGGRPRDVCDQCRRERKRRNVADYRRRHPDGTRGVAFARILASQNSDVFPGEHK